MTKYLLALMFLAVGLMAQPPGQGFVYVTVAPSGSCAQNATPRLLMPNGQIYTCQNGHWAAVAGSGGSGTVTSVSTTTPLSGGTFTTAGTISIGNIPVTKLNSGTGASATTFWKGNATWGAPFTLTTSGISGASTFSGGVLNIPNYAGGGGGGGCVPAGSATQVLTDSGAGLCTSNSGVTITGSGTTINATGGITTGTSPPAVTPGTGGIWVCGEGTAPSVGIAAGVDLIYCDSTQHSFLMSLNGATPAVPLLSHGIGFTLGDPTNSSALTTSYTAYITVPFACTIKGYNLLVNATDTTLRVKFWKIATGTAIPTVSQSISTSGLGVPSGTAIHSTTVSDFTTVAVAANDIMAMNVSVANTAKMVQGTLECDQ